MASDSGFFWYNLSYNVGYSIILYSGDAAILSMLEDVGVFTSVPTVADVPNNTTMWVFTFVRNPYDRILAAWNAFNINFIADPATKATAFHNKMLSLSGNTGPRNTRMYEKDRGDFQTQVELLDAGTGQFENSANARKQNFVGKIEDFATDIITVENQMGVSLKSEILDNYIFSMTNDTDIVFADTTYDVSLLYADAYALQTTKDLVYNTYREDFDAFSYKQ